MVLHNFSKKLLILSNVDSYVRRVELLISDLLRKYHKDIILKDCILVRNDKIQSNGYIFEASINIKLRKTSHNSKNKFLYLFTYDVLKHINLYGTLLCMPKLLKNGSRKSRCTIYMIFRLCTSDNSILTRSELNIICEELHSIPLRFTIPNYGEIIVDRFLTYNDRHDIHNIIYEHLTIFSRMGIIDDGFNTKVYLNVDSRLCASISFNTTRSICFLDLESEVATPLVFIFFSGLNLISRINSVCYERKMLCGLTVNIVYHVVLHIDIPAKQDIWL
ncbi:32.1 kDa protein [Psammotettix alienus reovirus]|nr:32.1 kDa protein [Psammotettix alienus reovirus]